MNVAEPVSTAALARTTPPALQLDPVQMLPLDAITADPQIRKVFDPVALDELADSIRAHGLIQPIVVRPPEGYIDDPSFTPSPLRPCIIIAGERRYRAAKIAQLQTIPAIVRHITAQDATVLQALENLQRQDLTLPETAAGVAALVQQLGFDKTVAQLGKSAAWVSKYSRIGELPEQVRDLVDSGQITSADIAHDLAQLIGLASELGTDEYNCRKALTAARNGTLTRAAIRDHLTDRKHAIEYYQTQEAERAKLTHQSEQDQAEHQKCFENDPEYQAWIEAQQELRRKQDQDWAEQRKAQEERRDALNALLDALTPRLTDWISRLAAATGHQPPTDESGEIIVDEEFHDGLLPCYVEPDLPGYWGDGPLPALDDVSLIMHLQVTRTQLETVIAALGAPAAEPLPQLSPIRIGGAVDEFIESRLQRDESSRIRSSDLWAAYTHWCAEQRVAALDPNALAETIEAAGIEKRRFKDAKYFLGVALSA